MSQVARQTLPPNCPQKLIVLCVCWLMYPHESFGCIPLIQFAMFHHTQDIVFSPFAREPLWFMIGHHKYNACM